MLHKTIVFFLLILVSLLVISIVKNGAFIAADLFYSLITAAVATLIFNVLYRGSTKKH
jgi:hypothetical protein